MANKTADQDLNLREEPKHGKKTGQPKGKALHSVTVSFEND